MGLVASGADCVNECKVNGDLISTDNESPKTELCIFHGLWSYGLVVVQ